MDFWAKSRFKEGAWRPDGHVQNMAMALAVALAVVIGQEGISPYNRWTNTTGRNLSRVNEGPGGAIACTVRLQT